MLLYLHIPFCRSKCGYCDFCSGPVRGLKADYLAALEGEVRARADAWSFSSVYVGGGTPSLLSPEELERLLGGLCLEPGAEVSIESNPEDVTPESLASWRNLGINRVSVGIQSLNVPELRELDRRPSVRESIRAMELLCAGWANWSVDLIVGMNGQTGETLRRTLVDVMRHDPPHLSLYALETKPESRIRPQEPDTVADLLLAAWALLADRGYRHYEISNFCRPGFECLHNLGYWHREDYLGCGASAHSFFGGVRYWNSQDVEDYAERMRRGVHPVEGEDRLTETEAEWEALMLGLRLDEGVEEKGGNSEKLGILESQGWIRRSGGRLALTEAGMMVFNDLALALRVALIENR